MNLAYLLWGTCPLGGHMFECAVVVSLLLVALFLFIAIDWYTAARTRKRIQAARAEEDDDEVTAVRRITVVSPEALPPTDTQELKLPWFAHASRWIAARRNWGPN